MSDVSKDANGEPTGCLHVMWDVCLLSVWRFPRNPFASHWACLPLGVFFICASVLFYYSG